MGQRILASRVHDSVASTRSIDQNSLQTSTEAACQQRNSTHDALHYAGRCSSRWAKHAQSS